MLDLPQATLIALTNKDWEGHKKAIDKSCEGINWGDVKIIWDEGIDSIHMWNYKVIYELPQYINTSHAMLVHADGYVVRPDLWKKEWLELDFIGAPWPLPQDSYSYKDEGGELQRVGNSVSLRSKRLMELVSYRPKIAFWDKLLQYGNCNEDGFVACHNRKWLESQGCKFASFEQALHFSKEHELPENKDLPTFAFHTVDS